MIEYDLLRSSQKMASIGAFKLEISSEQVGELIQENRANCEVKFRIQINGELNKAELILNLTRSSVQEKWHILKSDVKILWDVSILN